MTIQEAAKAGKVTENTVFNYIGKGYIYNLAIENNEIVIPNIPKPHIKRKPKTVAEHDNYILTAMNKEEYVNAKIMNIEQNKFMERLQALIKANKIFSKNENVSDFSSNIGFILVNSKESKVEIHINPKIEVAPKLEMNTDIQIGLVNAKVGI